MTGDRIDISIQGITPDNRYIKFKKAKAVIAKALKISGNVDKSHKEIYRYQIQEDLYQQWAGYFTDVTRQLYLFICDSMGLPRVTVVTKSSPLIYKGRYIYSPETGKPITVKEWNGFVAVLERFLNKKNSGLGNRIVLDAVTLGKLLNRMQKYNSLAYMEKLRLEKLKYRGHSFEWISENIKSMKSAFGTDFAQSELARYQVMQDCAAQRIVQVTDSTKNAVRTILLDGIKDRRSKTEVSQDLFNKLGGISKDWQRIADTEIVNASNTAYALDEVARAPEGEKVYFKRYEMSGCCAKCERIKGTVAIWSDVPLEKDSVTDPYAAVAIWEGKYKDFNAKDNTIPLTAMHPWCRGGWIRFYPDKRLSSQASAVLAEQENKSKRWGEACERAKKEFEKKGITNPSDRTPGYIERINELYRGEERKKINEAMDNLFSVVKNTEAIKKALALDLVQEFAPSDGHEAGKSLTYSGYSLQDRLSAFGLNISIENKHGSTRQGTDKDGHEWKTFMNYDYGYIRGTVGKDKDHLDVYVNQDRDAAYGEDEEQTKVFIVHQNDPVTNKYDEDKVMLGWNSAREAKDAYLKQYDRPGFFGSIETLSLTDFKYIAFDEKNKGKMLSMKAKEIVQKALLCLSETYC